MKNFKFEVKLFDFIPEAYMIMTDEYLFLEQYHMGRPKNLQDYFCVGGLVPIFKFNKKSQTYSYMLNQLDTIWKSELFNVIPFEKAMIYSADDKYYHSCANNYCNKIKNKTEYKIINKDNIRDKKPCEVCVLNNG